MIKYQYLNTVFMRIKIFVFLIVLGCCFACNQNKKKDTLKVLETKKATIERASKRGEEDLVDGLYKEVIDTSDELKKFESGVEQLQKSKNDSVIAFGIFDSQNKKYYTSASGHAEAINDSVLKQHVKILISSSLAKYDSTTVRHDSLLKNIITKEGTLKDLRNVLKIVSTLPLIEKYQEDNLPSPAPIEGFSDRQNELIKIADSLIKK